MRIESNGSGSARRAISRMASSVGTSRLVEQPPRGSGRALVVQLSPAPRDGELAPGDLDVERQGTGASSPRTARWLLTVPTSPRTNGPDSASSMLRRSALARAWRASGAYTATAVRSSSPARTATWAIASSNPTRPPAAIIAAA